MNANSRLWNASAPSVGLPAPIADTEFEHPLADLGNGRYRFRGFIITEQRNSAGRYWVYHPEDRVERNRWDASADDAPDVRMLSQALDEIDAWHDGGSPGATPAVDRNALDSWRGE